jgi:hypothetical protein
MQGQYKATDDDGEIWYKNRQYETFLEEDNCAIRNFFAYRITITDHLCYGNSSVSLSIPLEFNLWIIHVIIWNDGYVLKTLNDNPSEHILHISSGNLQFINSRTHLRCACVLNLGVRRDGILRPRLKQLYILKPAREECDCIVRIMSAGVRNPLVVPMYFNVLCWLTWEEDLRSSTPSSKNILD